MKILGLLSVGILLGACGSGSSSPDDRGNEERPSTDGSGSRSNWPGEPEGEVSTVNGVNSNSLIEAFLNRPGSIYIVKIDGSRVRGLGTLELQNQEAAPRTFTIEPAGAGFFSATQGEFQVRHGRLAFRSSGNDLGAYFIPAEVTLNGLSETTLGGRLFTSERVYLTKTFYPR